MSTKSLRFFLVWMASLALGWAASAKVVLLVNAGPDQTLTIPINQQTVATTLSAIITAIGGTNHEVATVSWTSSPSALVRIASPTRASTPVTFSAAGTYALTVTVKYHGLVKSDTVRITVKTAPKPRVVASAGPDQTVAPTSATDPTRVQLSGGYSLANLPTGTRPTIVWVQTDGPSPAVILNPGDLRPVVFLNKRGKYTFRLTVSAGGASDYDTVDITLQRPAADTQLSLDFRPIPVPFPPSPGGDIDSSEVLVNHSPFAIRYKVYAEFDEHWVGTQKLEFDGLIAGNSETLLEKWNSDVVFRDYFQVLEAAYVTP